MVELIHYAFEPVNLFFTLMLLLMMLYWLTVLLGLLDLNTFDLDLDGDVGIDLDGDVDVDADIDVGADGAGVSGLFRAAAEFFSLGRVPFMIVLSVLFLNLWLLAVLGNYYFNPNNSLPLAFVIALPAFMIACGITKIVIIPITRVFTGLDGSIEASRPLIGQVCRVTTTKVSKKLGQAEITTNGSPILLNVMSADDRVFHKGDEAVIVGRDDARGVYLIAPLNMET
jgi:hypothetical protein